MTVFITYFTPTLIQGWATDGNGNYITFILLKEIQRLHCGML